MPDVIPVDKSFASKLKMFLENGGKIIASYHSGLNPQKDFFELDNLGVAYKGDAPYSPDFILPKEHLAKNLPRSEHVMYSQGTLVDTTSVSTFIQMAIRPVFNRTYEHFCSHLHSPSSGEECYPAIVETKNTAYFIHPIFTQYQYNAPPWYKKLFRNELARLLPSPKVQHNGPSSIITNLLEQTKENRQILHILHYIPQRKCKVLDIVDEVIPLFMLEVTIQVPRHVVRVYTVPDKTQNLIFEQNGNALTFTIPEINGHHMSVIDFTNETGG